MFSANYIYQHMSQTIPWFSNMQIVTAFVVAGSGPSPPVTYYWGIIAMGSLIKSIYEEQNRAKV